MYLTSHSSACFASSFPDMATLATSTHYTTTDLRWSPAIAQLFSKQTNSGHGLATCLKVLLQWLAVTEISHFQANEWMAGGARNTSLNGGKLKSALLRISAKVPIRSSNLWVAFFAPCGGVCVWSAKRKRGREGENGQHFLCSQNLRVVRECAGLRVRLH